MASSADPIVGVAAPGDSPLLSRAITVNVAGVETVAQQAHFSGITYRAFDLQSGELTETPETLDKAVVIDDTPPTTGLLSGMNFSLILDGATYLAEARRRREIRVTFTLTGGSSFTRSFILGTGRSSG